MEKMHTENCMSRKDCPHEAASRTYHTGDPKSCDDTHIEIV